MEIYASSFDVTTTDSVVFLGGNVLYEISPGGDVRRIAGGGRRAPKLSPTPARKVSLGEPRHVAAVPGGGVLVSSFLPSPQVFRLDPDGRIRIVAGNGQEGPIEEGPATQSPLHLSIGLAATGVLGFLIVDEFGNAVHEVAEDGTIHTVAGTGDAGYSGEAGPAAAAQISMPISVEPTAEGGFLIGDMGNSRIREVSADGTITTVAGTGEPGYNGDGIPATSAQISGSPGEFPPVFPIGPLDIESTPDGGSIFVDSGNHRIRRVAPDGTITTVAGSGKGGYNGDGIPAATAHTPRGR